ncbi:hypothetical protein PoMZ_13231, partial [Pyricularia oryzae]
LFNTSIYRAFAPKTHASGVPETPCERYQRCCIAFRGTGHRRLAKEQYGVPTRNNYIWHDVEKHQSCYANCICPVDGTDGPFCPWHTALHLDSTQAVQEQL